MVWTDRSGMEDTPAPTIRRHGTPTWVWWTANKDAAWALYELRSDPAWDVVGLIATISRFDGRGACHGVRRELLEDQAEAAGLPLQVIECATRGGGSFSVCDSDLKLAFRDLRRRGAEVIAFGNLVPRLGDRPFALLPGTGLKPAFPLAGRNPMRHVETLFDAGLSAWVYAVEKPLLPATLVGRRFDEAFLTDLPPHINPSGENDEFQTFAEWAPDWSRRVRVAPRMSLECYGSAYVDLRPVGSGAGSSAFIGGSSAPPDGPDDPFDYFERLTRVRRHVDEHIGEELTLESVATVAALAPSSFGRYFRQRVGITFRSWLARHRVARACAMLRESDVTVGQVARALGFQCGRSFRRAFHATLGCSPTEYRKRLLPRPPVRKTRDS